VARPYTLMMVLHSIALYSKFSGFYSIACKGLFVQSYAKINKPSLNMGRALGFGVKVVVFNATWTIFQLYRGGHFY